MRRTIATATIAAAALLAAAGCTTTSTIHEFDTAGNLVKTTVTERDPFDKLAESTRNKTVVAWSNGWAAYISASAATLEDPTPTGKIFAGKVARGYLSVLPGHDLAGIAGIIAATREEFSSPAFASGQSAPGGNGPAGSPAAQ